MGKTKDIPKEKMSEISALLKHSNHSQRKIANLVNVSVMTVNRIKAKIDKKIPLQSARGGKCGRPRITSPRDDRTIRNICVENRRKSTKTLTKIIQEVGINISNRTTRRRIAELGFKCCRPAKKPKLTPAMKSKRLIWAKQHRHMSAEDWDNVCFSDESHIEILMDKSSFVRRRKEEKYNPDCVMERVKHPLKVMVWSVISGKGTGRLHIVEGMMNQEQYKKVLATKLIPQLHDWFPDPSKCLFMHDSAPCHKAKSVSTYLEAKKITVLPWPGNSPDLNPIENGWELLKRKIGRETITNKKNLIEALNNVWHKDQELKINVNNCIQSMPRRVQAVIAAKGGPTKY